MSAQVPGTLPRLTAIVACRNAAGTLPRLLDHFAAQGAEVIVIDQGSTDGTSALAAARRGAPVVEVRDEPFAGVFDLSRQLRLKRDLFRAIGGGWVVHADADEFPDAPHGLTLREFLALWDESPVLTFPCDEFVFLPEAEGAAHAPATFLETMRRGIPFRERNPKQRVFRAGAPLDLWLATGGHTVSLDPGAIAPEALRLRHYIGLSLDALRSDYLSRVFAPGDLARLWHATRMGAARFDIVAPPSEVLIEFADDWSTKGATDRLPVFAPRAPDTPAPAPEADLLLLARTPDLAGPLLRTLGATLPGLRVAPVTALPPGPVPPVLHALAHPAHRAPRAAADRVGHAEDWLRAVARARQAALAPGVRYSELRMEDADADTGLPLRLARRLLLHPPGRPRTGFVGPDAPLRTAAGFTGRLLDIAGALARDLRYG